MDDLMINHFVRRRGCCVLKKLDEETMSLLRKNLHKYGPVMEPIPPKRYKFKRTLKCSPAEMKRIEEAKCQHLAQEAEEAAIGIKCSRLIAYSSHTTNVYPNCDGLLPVDPSLPLVSDVPPPSWHRYLDTYQERRAAAEASPSPTLIYRPSDEAAALQRT
nr:hypothetical protein [Tanacetum cinerariifolium]